MIPGIFARTYASADPEAIFARLSGQGYRAVQFNLACAGLAPMPAGVPQGLAAGIGSAARRAGVTLAALSGTYNMIHPDLVRRKAGREALGRVVRAAHEMGAPLVTLCTGSRDPDDMWRAHPQNGSPDAWRDLLVEMDHALLAAHEHGIMLAIEPEPGNVIADAVIARRILDDVGSDRLGIVLDAANLLSPPTLARQHEVIAQATDLLGPDIVLAHAKDIDAGGRVVAAGRGAVDLPAFVAAIRAAGFDGALIAHGFAENDAPAVAHHLRHLIGQTSHA
ncbi:miscellaneous; hypothetical/partial homology [Caballeronia glathei]|uniref:Epimerase n=1 Tax=Caballeronia glathei TaxID=60547 RepID=A0A069PZN8_9BURK|nr:sugar phosphate isomerase/epimerase [Caballeronia glathei]KDR42941.1 epimerase [Caballeronia glathei]CDY75398.1 miscellaneous; hypothetical/partial homology [Caballeronia glathei]